MSLPTPPSTSHRDKENRLPPGSRISWSQHNEYHCLATSPPPKQPPKPSGSRSPPTKSILKKSIYVPLPFADESDNEMCKKQREVTPEPADPLTNLSYLANSVDKIIALDDASLLRDLIEAYSVLTARLKGTVNGTTDADASWPLFQPLRRHRDAVISAFIRDLGRALVDPGLADTEGEERRVLLPSPQSSPKQKKGMSAEQVKYARDLCTTSHAVIKLLAVVFTLPAIYRVFTDEQLREVLTHVLAIPIKDELPTPNARKTCALAIWLIQSQRLPSEVLLPAKDRIAYALRRGIEGELGKEGKKGSANDGLKAIHELSTYQPATFLPAFTPLLPSILSNLLAPTLALRTQACHALGGLVLALTSLPACLATLTLHARISTLVATFLTTTAVPSTSSPSRDPMIVRTIRTTLQATEPQHAAQGPVWALTVLANLTILLGPKLYTDAKLNRIMTALLSLSMRHKKSSVRGLGCLVWRCVSWVWFQPPFPKYGKDDEMQVDDAGEEKKQTVREMYWRVVKSVVDVGAGVATIAALLNEDSSSSANDEDRNLKRVMQVMRCMIKKGGQTCGEAMEILKIFVSSDPSSPSPSSSEWNPNKLLPPSLFNALPGLLSAEYKGLVNAVKPIFDQCPQLEDVRSLTREEIAKEWVFDELVDIWRRGLCYLELPEDCGTPAEVIAVWEGLLTANVSVLQDTHNDNAEMAQFAIMAADILIDILQDANLDLTTKAGPPRKVLSSSSPIRAPPSSHSNTALKVSITRDLWTTIRTTVPLDDITAAAEKLLACLVNNEDDWVCESDSSDDARKQWAMFCAEVLLVCDLHELRLFWSTSRDAGNEKGWSKKAEVRRLVWDCFVQKWKAEGEWHWEGAVVLLAMPFVDTDAWDLDNDGFGMWDDFLGFAVNKALDYGVDCSTVLDQVAFTISQNPTPAFEDSARIVDLLLTHLDISDARQMPSGLFDFVNDILHSTYPPEPRNKITSSWLLRSLTRAIDACPVEFVLNLLETIQDGVSLWISDSYDVFTAQEYEDEILPMYQTILFGIQLLPRTVETLEAVSGIVGSAFCGRKNMPISASDAFTNFWNINYSSMEEPVAGWPEKIQSCLRAVAAPANDVSMIDPVLLAEDATGYDADVSMESEAATADDTFEVPTPDDKDPLLSSESEDEQESPVQSLLNMVDEPESIVLPELLESSPAAGQLGPAFAPAPTESQLAAISSTFDAFGTPVFDSMRPPSTPAKAPLLTFTPPRPSKISSAPATFLTLPLRSPATPLPSSQRTATTPRRTPLSVSAASCASPSKRRLVLKDKENVSPHPIIPSFTERLALRSAAWSIKDTVLGKRRAIDEWQEGSVPKKHKVDSREATFSPQIPAIGSDDSEDERLVEKTLVNLGEDGFQPPPLPVSIHIDDPFTVAPAAFSSTTSNIGSSGPSPKKRKRVLIDAVEVPTLREIIIKEKSATLDKQVFRRTRSATRSLGPSSVQSSVYESLDKSSRKRSDRRSSDDFFSTSLSRTLEDINVVGSDDSIIWVTRLQAQAPPELSSDDDPHLGQVTPHHLISPALRRVQNHTSDLPSDDSNMSASPSHGLASRRRQRLTSFSYLKSTPV